MADTVEDIIEQPPALEETFDDEPGIEGESEGKKQSRIEKKVRKSLEKTDLKQLENIKKITVKKGKQTIFYISQPDVFKAPSGELFVAFGAPQTGEDFSNMAGLQEALGGDALSGLGDLSGSEPEKITEIADEGPVDETGLNPADIELVMQNAPGASRAKAVAALRATNNEPIAAIIEASKP